MSTYVNKELLKNRFELGLRILSLYLGVDCKKRENIMKKFLSIAMLACAVSFAEAAVDAKPLRLGPVSVYGALGKTIINH